MSEQRFASVWDAIEDTPAEAENRPAAAQGDAQDQPPAARDLAHADPLLAEDDRTA